MATREDFASAVGALIKGRSPVGHGHTLGQVSGLQTTLDAKLDVEAVELSTQDLNTIVTPGYYYQSHSSEATVGSNYPVASAGALKVSANASRSQVQQTYTTFLTSNPERFWRTFFANSWSSWRKVVDGNDSRLNNARTPTEHSHPIGQVTGLRGELDGKIGANDARLTDAREPLAHEHGQGDIEGLDDTLAATRWVKGNLATGTDLNTVRTPGVYSTFNKTTTDSLLNTPPDATAGVLEVLEATGNAHIQRYSMYSGGHGSKVWTRRTLSVSAGTWTAWEVLATASDITRAGWVKGVVPEETDLNDLTEPGIYSTYNKTTFESLLNTPPDAAAGAIEVIRATTGTYVQRYMGYGGSGADSRVWIRRTASAASGTWSPWRALATTDEVNTGLSGKAGIEHTHEVTDVAGLAGMLDGKADTGHTHQLSELYGVGTELDEKLDVRLAGVASAYDVAVAEGFTGTVYDWLSSLVGPEGPEGPYGGTAVTDPQVASYITGDTDTRDALDAGYRRSLSVREHGATGDGETDDTAAVNATVTAAAAFGLPVHVPAGVYRMTGPLTLPSGTDLRMDTGAVLDFSQHTGSTHVVASGVISTGYVPITGGAEKGSQSITVDPSGLTTDDWIRVASNDLYDSANTRVTYGELVQVREAGDGTVTLWTPLCGTYTTAPTIQRVQMIRDVHITGGTIRGNFTPQTGKTGVHATFVENMRIHRTRIEGIDTRHIAFDSCVNAWATELDDYWALTTGTAYGVSFVNMCRDSGVRNSRFRYVRHAFSTNNNLDGPNVGIVRRITFAHNVIDETSRAIGGSMAGGTAIDTHGAAEDIDILYNTVNGATGAGINVECRSGRIIGNRLIDCENGGIVVHNETDLDGDFTIQGNSMIRTGSGFYGIYVYAGTRGGAGKHRGVVITGNSIEGGGHGIGVGRSGGERRDEAVTITGNTIRDVSGRGIYVAGVDTLTEGDNTVINATANGLYVTDVAHASFGPTAVRMTDTFTGWAVYLGAITWATFKPGSIRAESGIGIRIANTCENMTIGAYSHVHAATPLSNAAGPTVVITA